MFFHQFPSLNKNYSSCCTTAMMPGLGDKFVPAWCLYSSPWYIVTPNTGAIISHPIIAMPAISPPCFYSSTLQPILKIATRFVLLKKQRSDQGSHAQKFPLILSHSFWVKAKVLTIPRGLNNPGSFTSQRNHIIINEDIRWGSKDHTKLNRTFGSIYLSTEQY